MLPDEVTGSIPGGGYMFFVFVICKAITLCGVTYFFLVILLGELSAVCCLRSQVRYLVGYIFFVFVICKAISFF